MSVQIRSGVTSDVQTIDATSKAARVTIYDTAGNSALVESQPDAQRVVQFPGNNLGSYSLAMDNGATVIAAGAQANTEWFQWRWRNTANLCLVRSVRISHGAVVAYAAGRLTYTLTVARAFSVVGSGTASTVPTISGNLQKMKTGHDTSLLIGADVVMAGTSVLSAGTKTLDTQPLAVIATAAPTTVGPIITNQTLWEQGPGQKYPLVLAADEGFALRISCPGTGTYFLGVTVEWTEIAGLTYP